MTEFRLPTARADYIGLALAADGPGVTAWWGTQHSPRSAARWPRPDGPPAWRTTDPTLDLSADGEWISTYDHRAGEVRVSRVGAKTPVAVLPFRHDGPFLWSTVVPGGGAVAWASRGQLHARRLPGGEPEADVRTGFMYDLGCSPGGRWLTGVGERVVRVYDRAAGYAVRRLKVGQYTRVAAADEPVAVAIDTTSKAVGVWNLTGPPAATVLPAGGLVTAVAVSADGRRVLTGTETGEVALWDAAGDRLAVYDWGGLYPIALAFAPDRLTAAAGGGDGRVVVWDLEP